MKLKHLCKQVCCACTIFIALMKISFLHLVESIVVVNQMHIGAEHIYLLMHSALIKQKGFYQIIIDLGYISVG